MNINEIVVGDTLDFSTEVPQYTPADGWTLKYRLIPRVTGTAITLTSAPSDGVHRVQVGPSTTANWTAGHYSWVSWVEKTGARYTVGEGQVTLKPDPAAVNSPLDNRSHARKVLEAINAVIEKRATIDQQEFTIGDKSLKRMTVTELIKFRQVYANEVAAEDAADRLQAGRPPKNRILTRF